MIGIVGDDADTVAELVEEAGTTALTGDAETVVAETADAVLALGEDALYALVRANVDAPVLPVNAGRGVESIRKEEIATEIGRLAADDYDTRSRPLLSVSVGDREFRALADVMLVTDEPARISEYGIRGANEVGDLTSVDSVRADGVVVSTPVGSVAYGSDAGGPVISPALDAVSVVPIAPFRVERSRWVLAPPIQLTVEREEADVVLLTDDNETCHVPAGEPVDLTWGKSITFVRSPTAQEFFEGASRLEKT